MGSITERYNEWKFKKKLPHVINIHTSDRCKGRVCVVHRPSNHHMSSWPMVWRNDRGIVERVCEHGVGHPDPDQLYFWREINQTMNGIHGCDLCCVKSGK